MCADVICEYLHLARMAGMDDIIFDDINPDMCENVGLG